MPSFGELPRVAIIGTGVYGRSLAQRFVAAGIPVTFGSRSAGGCKREVGGAKDNNNNNSYAAERTPLFIEGVPVERPCAAVARADIIVLAVPLSAHCTVARCIAHELAASKTAHPQKKIIIDISNAPLDSVGRNQQRGALTRTPNPISLSRNETIVAGLPSPAFTTKGGVVYVSVSDKDADIGGGFGINRGAFDGSVIGDEEEDEEGGSCSRDSNSVSCATACGDAKQYLCNSAAVVVDIENCAPTCPKKGGSTTAADLPTVTRSTHQHHQQYSRREETGGVPAARDRQAVEGESNAESLQRMMPAESVSVVKAFNTVGAHVIRSHPGEMASYDDRVLVCGDSREAKARVAALIAAIGMRAVDAGSLSAARDVERLPLRFFGGDWRHAFCASVLLFLLAFVYVGVRDIVLAGKEARWGDLFLLKFNVALGWHSLAMMSATFFGGLVAAVRQLWTGTARDPFPAWLDGWLRARKAMGLMGLASGMMHACSSLATDSLFTSFSYLGTHPGQAYQVSMLFAILTLSVFVVLGITSIPSVGSTLSWNEWQFIQSKLGHFGVALAAVHALTMGYAVGDFGSPGSLSSWPHHVPPVSVIAGGVACAVVALRLLLALPFVSSRIDRIRSSA